jgi:DNA repair protein RecN (Recombination protein N)
MAEASLEIAPGLTVVTGETGAGKSLVVDSLSLLAGVRASTDLVRTGADTLTVNGVFQPAGTAWRRPLEEAGIDVDGDEIVIRREVSRSGRNRVFVNDQPVTLRLLASVAPYLLRIHGQGEESGLLEADLQRRWLDRVGGDQGRALVERCALAYDAYRGLAERFERLTGDERLRHERIDLLRFQVQEIEQARVEDGEEVALRAERDVLRHAEAIVAALGGAAAHLSEDEGSALERLGRAQSELREVAAWQPEAASWSGELEELQARVDDLARVLQARLDGLEADPERLNAIEDRLSVLERLMRKYGSGTGDVLEHLRTSRAALEELEIDESDRDELEVEVAEALAGYRSAALELSAARETWSEELRRRVEDELRELGLREARFAVRLERPESAGSPLVIDGRPVASMRHGVDRVVFDFAPNPGEDARPLARIASGGELSRVYLALQLVARGAGSAPAVTLVFDEVDAGVGGMEAAMVGRKLKRLARGGQVLAVTHLAQVASCGDAHFRLEKAVVGRRTEVTVDELDPARRVAEVARMLAGETVTELSRSHAEELLASSQEEG